MFNNHYHAPTQHRKTPNSSSAAECMHESRELKARAERYRRLAESLFDANIIAVVLACARELDQNAERLRENRDDPPDDDI